MSVLRTAQHNEIVGGLKQTIVQLEVQNKDLEDKRVLANAIIKEQSEKIADLEKKLSEKDIHVKKYSGMSSDRDKIINRLHDILDLLPGVIDRKHENGYSDNEPEKRLNAWLLKVAFANKVCQ